ncbi:MAG: hypothetical protein ACK553_04365 [Planctomycetota bacterium]
MAHRATVYAPLTRLDLVWKFKKYYQGSVAGMPDSMAAHAAAHQHRWRRGQRAVRRVFAAAG